MDMHFSFPNNLCSTDHAEEDTDDQWLKAIEDEQLLGAWFELLDNRFNDEHRLAIQNELYSRGIQVQL